MRWFIGILKIFLVICLVAFVSNFIFAYTLGIKPFSSIYERVKWFKDSEPKKNIENQAIGNETDKTENSDLKAEPSTEKKADEESEKNNSIIIPDKYFMTFNEVNSIENISLRDKLTGLSIISKIKKADIERVYELADGGITLDELKEIKRILEKNLSKDEIEKLDDILTKNRKLYAEGKLAN